MYRHGVAMSNHADEQTQQAQSHRSIRRNLNSTYSGFRSTTFQRSAEDRNQLLLEAELRLAQRDKRWFQSALAEANHKLEDSEREIKRLSVFESELRAMESKFKSSEAEKTKVLDMVRKGVSEAEKAIEDERNRFHERTKEYELKLKESLELGAEAKAEAKDLEEQLAAAREEIRSSEHKAEMEISARVETVTRNMCRLEEQLRVANDRIEFIMKENECKEKTIQDLESERDNLKRRNEEERASFEVKMELALKQEREKHEKIVSMLKRDIEVASMRDELRKVEKPPVVVEKKQSKKREVSQNLIVQHSSAASTNVLDELNRKLSFLQDRNVSVKTRPTKKSTIDVRPTKTDVDRKLVVAETKVPRYMQPRRTTETSPPSHDTTTKENWQSNLRGENALRRSNHSRNNVRDDVKNVASRKQSSLRVPKRISKKPSVLSERQNRIRPAASVHKHQMGSNDVDPQKKALVRVFSLSLPITQTHTHNHTQSRLRERRKRNRSKHVSPKLTKQEMIRRRREQEKKRHAKERMRLRRNEMRKQKNQRMQEQAEIQMKSMLSETRVKARSEKEHENTRRNKMAPPPLPPPRAVSLPVHHVDYTDKENDASFEDDIQSGTSSDVETFLRESEESNRRVQMLRERREQLRGRLLRTSSHR